MSELKRCPFCGKTLIADGVKFFVHPVVGCLLDGIPIKNDAESIKRWNTRKPMDRIVERLEQQAKQYNRRAKELANKSTEAGIHNKGKACSYEHAIEIVKEEGGLNE
jgi:hypothetical protein